MQLFSLVIISIFNDDCWLFKQRVPNDWAADRYQAMDHLVSVRTQKTTTFIIFFHFIDYCSLQVFFGKMTTSVCASFPHLFQYFLCTDKLRPQFTPRWDRFVADKCSVLPLILHYGELSHIYIINIIIKLVFELYNTHFIVCFLCA